ncbi:MAG: site-specific integrase [Spirochaetaceae bacterium]|nr:site-specific integrase [Spirochaetaceae bacterium]MCF7951153.1 site-specific integrase [Spirochaetaceae bacterium]
MAPRKDYVLFKRKRKKATYWYFYYWEGNKRIVKSTGKTVKWQAEKKAEDILNTRIDLPKNLTLKEYASPFFIWDKCPHLRRLRDEKKSVTKYHAKNERNRIENHLLKDLIAQKTLTEIKRKDLLDYRSRLLTKLSEATANKVMKAVKTIFKEALLREDIERDPTVGIGMVSYESIVTGIFTMEEIVDLFPPDSLVPWKDIYDYTCFLLAATTGMRRSEILALKWKNISFDKSFINIVEAWKDRDEIGKPKWNKTRIVPISNRTKDSLLKLKEQSHTKEDDDLVFCYANGQRFGGTWWQKRFRNAMNRAKIDYETRHLKPHSFRHTLNTLLRNAGQDPAKIRAALGWSGEAIQENYTHWQIEHLQDQATIVENLFSNNTNDEEEER